MSFVIDGDGKVKRIGATVPKIEQITTDDVKNDPAKVARAINAISAATRDLYSRAPQPRGTFTDIVLNTSGASSPIILQHNFGGPVIWWVSNYVITGTAGAPQIEESPTNTDPNVLVLHSYKTGTVSITVEKRGV